MQRCFYALSYELSCQAVCWLRGTSLSAKIESVCVKCSRLVSLTQSEAWCGNGWQRCQSRIRSAAALLAYRALISTFYVHSALRLDGPPLCPFRVLSPCKAYTCAPTALHTARVHIHLRYLRVYFVAYCCTGRCHEQP